jgi:hypothetical protein
MSDQTTEPANNQGEVTITSALDIANREAFIVGHPYTATVAQSPNGDMIELKLTRMVGGVAREFTMAVGRRMDVASFTELSRGSWAMMLEKAERAYRMIQWAL